MIIPTLDSDGEWRPWHWLNAAPVGWYRCVGCLPGIASQGHASLRLCRFYFTHWDPASVSLLLLANKFISGFGSFRCVTPHSSARKSSFHNKQFSHVTEANGSIENTGGAHTKQAAKAWSKSIRSSVHPFIRSFSTPTSSWTQGLGGLLEAHPSCHRARAGFTLGRVHPGQVAPSSQQQRNRQYKSAADVADTLFTFCRKVLCYIWGHQMHNTKMQRCRSK